MPFNLGIGEMILVFLVGLLLTGGKRLPAIAADLGRQLRELKGSIAKELERSVLGELVPREASRPQADYGAAVRTLLACAGTEAVRLQHASVRSEHLLMALTLEPDRATELVLLSGDVRLEQLQWRLKESLVLGDDPVNADPAYAGSAKQVIQRAMGEAEALGHRRVEPVHVLLALIGQEDVAGDTLASLGVTLAHARAETARALSVR